MIDKRVENKVGELVELLIHQNDGEKGQEFLDREADIIERLSIQTEKFLIDEKLL